MTASPLCDNPTLPAGGELPLAFAADLMDPAYWHEGLDQYARTTNLAVALVDGEGRLRGPVLNPQPLWSLFRARRPAAGGACPFCLTPLQPCAPDAACAQGGLIIARDRMGLVHVAVPLLLGQRCLGLLLAGQVFDQYPDQLALDHAARQFGLSPQEVWHLARQEHPVKRATLHVYGELLQTLGRTFLLTRYHTLREAERLTEMTALRDRAVEAMTERRQAEAALHTSERKFLTLLEKLPAGAYTCDPSGLIAYFNPKAVEIWGRTPRLNDPADRFGGALKLFATDGTPLARDQSWMALALQRNQEYSGCEVVIERTDGSRLTVLAHVNPIRDESGNVLGAVNVLVDITERKRAEEQLHRREKELADFFDNATLGLHWLGPDGIVLRANRAELDLLGYTPEEYVGHSITEFHADPEVIDDLLRRLRAGQELHSYEARLRCKDGSLKHVLISSNVLWENGAFVHTRSFIRDVTEQKRADETLRQYTAALKDADRRKDEFLAMLAHELRNPLAPVLNAVQILKLRGSNEPELVQARDMIDRQIRQMTRLVDDVLDVSRITSGKVRLQRETIDLAEVVGRALDTSRPPIEARHHQLTVHLPLEPLWVDGDLTRLAQVVANLLNNAAKYTPEGGRIELTVERGADAAVLRVRDNGEGLAADMLPRVFDLFAQADQSLAHAQGGLGIGLSLVRRLTEMHGGRVEAFSAGPGQGSEFVVRLPLLKEDGGRRKEEALCPPPAVAHPPKRILVVDDNRDAAESLAMLLRLFANEVHTAHDGRLALAEAEAYRPDVILLDIGLPGMNGYDVARALRKIPGLSKVVLVALTGYGTEEDRRRAHEAGFDAHLVKPVELETLQEILAHPARAGQVEVPAPSSG